MSSSPSPNRSDTLRTLLRQLDASQWLPKDAHAEQQRAKIHALLNHAVRHSPFYRQRLAGLSDPQGRFTLDRFSDLPLLTRADLQHHRKEIDTPLPSDHGGVGIARSSGTTGQMVEIQRSGLNNLIWEALTLREHLWHRRDPLGRLAVARAGIGAPDAPPIDLPSWGAPVADLFTTGPSSAVDLRTAIPLQGKWLAEFQPHYLLTYPTNLDGLLDLVARGELRLPALKGIRTIGELLAPRIRQRCRELLGLEIADTYSSQELGVIALQCPQSGLYHLQSESLRIEILDDGGKPCAEGQVGEVITTDLHNFATPLIRYRTGDHAEVGPPCPCGRGLPTLRRILGRTRQMALRPGQGRFWPLTGAYHYAAVAPISQFQMVQTGEDALLLRYRSDAPLSDAQLSELSAIIQETMGYPYRVGYEFHEQAIPASAGGKFEEFICLVAQAGGARP